MALPDDEWFASAECRSVDVNGAGFFKKPYAREALAACRRCPVTEECLRWALWYHEVGLWGGMSERQRRRLSFSTSTMLKRPRAVYHRAAK